MDGVLQGGVSVLRQPILSVIFIHSLHQLVVTNAVGLVSLLYFLAQMMDVSEEILVGISTHLALFHTLALSLHLYWQGSSPASFPECLWSAVPCLWLVVLCL